MHTRALDRSRPRTAAPTRGPVRPAGLTQLPTARTYSVVATFLIGGPEWYYRVAIRRTQFDFRHEVERAFVDGLGLRGVVVQSATASVGPETVQTHLIDADSGQWPVQLNMRFVSPALLTRDEWLSVLAKAFMWAYRITWRYTDGGNGYSAVASFGSSGDPSRFVEAANSTDRLVLQYVGGSMLDLGPVGAPSPQPQPVPQPTTRPRTAGPEVGPSLPLATHSTRAPVDSAEDHEPIDPGQETPLAPAAQPTGIVAFASANRKPIAGGLVALTAAGLAYVLWPRKPPPPPPQRPARS